METIDIQVTCGHDPDCKSGGESSHDALFDIRNGALDIWREQLQTPLKLSCCCCGCEYELFSDGQNIDVNDISRPRIDGVSAGGSGSISGGSSLIITGHRLEGDDIVVKINGVPCTNIRNMTGDSLECDIPAGDLSLEQEGLCWQRIDISFVSGTFQVDEHLQGGTSGRKCVVKEIHSDHLYLMGAASCLAHGETLTGLTSGATCTMDLYHQVQIGETATGLTSGATGVLTDVKHTKPRVNQVTGNFQGGEWAEASVSKTRIELKSTPLDGSAIITVENQYGQRSEGGSLSNAFTYTP